MNSFKVCISFEDKRQNKHAFSQDETDRTGSDLPPDADFTYSSPSFHVYSEKRSNVHIGFRHPDTHVSSRYVLVGHIRLDNYAEMANAFEHYSSHNPSPGELILETYHRSANKVCDIVRGDFCFVIWDKNRKTAFAARDHIGVFPLFFSEAQNGITIANNPALLSSCRAVIDVQKVARYLTGSIVYDQNTFLSGTKRLSAAHTLTASKSSIKIARYWEPRPNRIQTNDATKNFRNVLLEAVASRIPSKGAFSTLLSGGLDSSTISVAAKEMAPIGTSLSTYSITFDELPSIDERRFIDDVSERIGAPNNKIEGAQISSIVGMDELIGILGSPVMGTSSVRFFNFLKVISLQDTPLLLDGHGGDEVISHGRDRLVQLAEQRRWLALAYHIPTFSRVTGANSLALFCELFLKNSSQPVSTQIMKRLVRRLARLVRSRNTDAPALTKYLSAKTLQYAHSSDVLKKEHEEGSIAPSSDNLHADSLRSDAIPCALEHFYLMSQHLGIEMRFPFFDLRVVETALSVPPSQRFKRNSNRSIVREAFSKELPLSVLTRQDKANFTAAVKQDLVANEELLNNMIEANGPLASFLEAERFRALVFRLIQEPETLNGMEINFLVRAVSLHKWLSN